jgi:uncharacterized protein YfdQ (DUF2303 family)
MATEAESIASLAVQAQGKGAIVKTANDREFLIFPNGQTCKDVTDEHHDSHTRTPAFVKQHVTLQTVDSLVDYVNRFKLATTMLFADIGSSVIRAAIDYHDSTADHGEDDYQARRLAHNAKLTLEHSVEWKLWADISGRLKPQGEFARFIEENAADIHAPDAATLLEAVRDIQAKRNVNFTKAVRTASFNEDFHWSDTTEAKGGKGSIELPTKFVLGLPVYFGQPETELHAFLRWKLDDGSLALGIQLHRAEQVRQAVFKQIVLDAAERTECPIVFGKVD